MVSPTAHRVRMVGRKVVIEINISEIMRSWTHLLASVTPVSRSVMVTLAMTGAMPVTMLPN